MMSGGETSKCELGACGTGSTDPAAATVCRDRVILAGAGERGVQGSNSASHPLKVPWDRPPPLPFIQEKGRTPGTPPNWG